ncbi:uncharacterized protein LOC125449736 [Stegostoma tigrinum]|uniref:uncharacterized protein LOC125449736 n=1 Tax=Stegostoma tigrinum TaxID=3053191 RepID=UPI0028705E6F|nr:uncharacterized protein LOC125449736 [Stegostoma tigrinum]
MSVIARSLSARCPVLNHFPAACQPRLKSSQSTIEVIPVNKNAGKRERKCSEDGSDAQGKSWPRYVVERLRRFEKLKSDHEEMLRERILRESRPIEVRLPGGKSVEGQSWKTSPYHIARAISCSVSESAIVARVNGELWDLLRPLEADSSVELLEFDNEGAKAVFWHSSAHLLGAAMEHLYGGLLCRGPPTEYGFFYDIFMNGRDRTSGSASYRDSDEKLNNQCQAEGIGPETMRLQFTLKLAASGYLHKALQLDGQPYIIEELQLFPGPEPVHSVLLSSEKAALYVTSSTSVLEVPVSNCTAYPSCGQCVLSRDPYCAWDARRGACKETRGQQNASRWLQDIENAEAGSVCFPQAQPRMHTPREVFTAAPAEPVMVTVPENSLVNLPCRAPSNLAQTNWTHDGERAAEAEMIEQPFSLWLVATSDRQGLWECWATENGFKALMASYMLQMGARETLAGVEGQLPWAGIAVKTYWNELVLVSTLLALSILALVAYIAYHRSERCRSRRGARVSQVPTDDGEQEEIRPGSQSPEDDTRMRQTHHSSAEGNPQDHNQP